MKMTISIPDALSDKINAHNKETLIPKSVIIQLALNQYFQSQDLFDAFKDLRPILDDLKKMKDVKSNQ